MADENGTPRIVSLKEAKQLGLRHYFTGVPCRHGHLSPRFVSCFGCLECCKANVRKRRKDNPEHARKLDRKYKNENREKLRRRYREQYAQNPAKFVEKTKRYYRENSERVRRRRKAYHYRTYVFKETRDKAIERTKQWAQSNPDRVKEAARNAKAKRRSRENSAVGVHTQADVIAICAAQKGKCAYCRETLASKYHVDHIMPLAKGGNNQRRNLQILCGKCNLAKGARDPIVHAQSLGFLL